MIRFKRICLEDHELVERDEDGCPVTLQLRRGEEYVTSATRRFQVSVIHEGQRFRAPSSLFAGAVRVMEA